MAEANDTDQAEQKVKAERAARTAIPIPWMNSYGSITKALENIKTASTPDRFTQDFLSTKLGLRGGSPKPVIPFLKRTGFLNGDGAPTDQYRKFRNDATSGAAAAAGLKLGFAPLYEINEYCHDLNDKELKGVIVQATGLDSNASTVGSIAGSFKALRAFAKFDADQDDITEPATEYTSAPEIRAEHSNTNSAREIDLKLGYTINLNLPATSDVAVFNAIFKSLRENLLD